ncbi:hypothetical protein DEO72_LG2g2682 [Vigna unguiculata]|uniref:Uncharacterized protein n=1 Tax=Vigna unguiculata TaxID=3917 RepID=A0A4D6L1J4_VIGUN|nr:hypothetical protein DEO72_LG2g2682 [Vigna unguiculata]
MHSFFLNSRASFSRSPSVRSPRSPSVHSPLGVRSPSAGRPHVVALFARRLRVVCTVSARLRAPLASSAHRSPSVRALFVVATVVIQPPFGLNLLK